MYGTREPLDKLLSVTSIFKQSPLTTILHSPEAYYKLDSILPPTLFFKFLAAQSEPSIAAYLPSLAINKDQWKENDRPHELYVINGGFFDNNLEHRGYLSRNKLMGYHWLQIPMYRSALDIVKDGVIYGSISVAGKKVKVMPVIHGSEVKFRIKASYYAGMYEYIEDMSSEEMSKIAANKIKEEIMATYKEGLSIGVDIFHLEESLYRKKPRLWRKLSNDGHQITIDKDSIEKLDIDITIPYNGKFKRQR